jgi:hypothetical protein
MVAESACLVKVNPVTALTVDVTAVPMRTVTKEWTFRDKINGFDLI